MGQQQLLLLVLSTIIVGVSIVVGIGMFQDSAMNANIDTVTQENVTIASKATEWFNKSVALGGGGGDFSANGGVTLQKLGHATTAGNAMRDSSEIGIFVVTVTPPNVITITGTTNEVDDNSQVRQVETILTMNAVTGSATITSEVTAAAAP